MSAKTKDKNAENSWREECPGWKGTKETYGVFGINFFFYKAIYLLR